MKFFINVLLVLPLSLFAYRVDFVSSLEKTLENNKGLKAKKLELEVAKVSLNEAQAYDYGSLVFSENMVRTNHAGYVFGMKLASREASFGDFGFNEFLAQMGGLPGNANSLLATKPNDLNHPKTRTNYETKVTYQAPLFTGFKLENGKKMAQLQLLAQQAKYQFDEKQLTLEVVKAYNGAVAAKEFIKATTKAKEATSSFVNFAQELYKEGLVTNIDVKQAMVYDMGVEAQIIEAQNRFELAIAYLRFLTSDDTITDIAEFANIQYETVSLEIIGESLYEKRDDLQWMDYNTQTMKSKIEFEKSANYPTIGMQVEYGFNDDTLKLNDVDEKDYYLGAIALSYTLFDGGLNSQKIQKSKIQHKQMNHNFEYMKDGVKLEVEKNILTLKAKEKVLEQKIKALKLSDEVLEQSTQMYKNHLMSMNTLLMQQANQQQANAQMILAKYEKSLAAAEYKISLGESL